MKGIKRIATAFVLIAAVTAPAWAYAGSQYAGQAKVSLTQARGIAVKAYPGKIISQELEKEKGGSGLRYSFVIQHGAIKHEVGVDAASGKVLQNMPENANAD